MSQGGHYAVMSATIGKFKFTGSLVALLFKLYLLCFILYQKYAVMHKDTALNSRPFKK